MLGYARRRWRTFVPLSAFHDGPADDYELAMLTEGRDLVVLVALLNLESAGALELARRESRLRWRGESAASATSIVASVGWLAPPSHPMERAVFRAVRAGSESEESIATDTAVRTALDDLHQRLVLTGLLEPPPLIDDPELDDFIVRSLVGHELVRRLRRNHPVESVGTLVALFGEKILTDVDSDLARRRAPTRPVVAWRTIALGDTGGDGTGECGEAGAGSLHGSSSDF
jgi:hypothetical protein